MMLATDLAVLDHSDGSVLLVANAINYDDTDERVEQAWRDAVVRLDRWRPLAARRLPWSPRWTSLVSRRPWLRVRPDLEEADHIDRVERRAKGTFVPAFPFQVVLSQRFSMDTDADPLERCIARCGQEIPARTCTSFASRRPTAAASPWWGVLGGARPSHRRACHHASDRRIATSQEDPGRRCRSGRGTAADPKERSEHVMLVDLGRNDLGRVCRAGTVDVVEFMDIRRYSHIMHIESTVVGDLRPETAAYEVLRATFRQAPSGRPNRGRWS